MNALTNRLAQRLPIFYGYVMLPLAMLLQIGSSPGQTFAVSAFTPALLDSLQLSESRLGLAYMLGTLCASIPLAFVGPVTDRIGLKPVACVVALALAGACVFASTVQSFLGLLVAFFLLRFLGQGAMTLLAANTNAMWFRARLGRVSAALSVGSAIAFAWVPDWIASAIERYGWRETYNAIGGLLLLAVLPAILLLYRNRPEDIGQCVDGLDANTDTMDQPAEESRSIPLSRAARTASYGILGFCNIVWAMAGTGILFYLFTLCDDRGIDQGNAKSLFKILGLSMLAAQLTGGILADFLKLNRLFGCGTCLIAAALVWLSVDTTLSGARGFSVLFGGGQGLLISVTSVIMVRFYGRKYLGSIRGAIWCGTVAGSGCGPLIMGLFKDSTGSYEMAITCFAVVMTPLALASWFIRAPQPPMATTESR
ncbi:MAG: MFS transporter [Planctomycetota bacterium]